MSTKFSIDNKEPVRLKKPLHHIKRKHQQRKIQNQNYKIHKNLCGARSVIPNSNELQQRWRQQKVIKQLSYFFVFLYLLCYAYVT